MKKFKLVYNPRSGDASFKGRLDRVIGQLQKTGIEVHPWRLGRNCFVEDLIKDMKQSDDYFTYDGILVSGGDGTISNTVSAMIKHDLKIPIGIFPYGTANDFATYLGINKNVDECCDIIINGNTRDIDVGMVNGNYFINVVSVGKIMGIPHNTDTQMKNALGKIAYYIKGLEELPKITAFKAEIVLKDRTILEEELFLILVMNSTAAGGFGKLAPDAAVDDGMLDVVAIRSGNLPELLGVFIKIMTGDVQDDPRIHRFQAESLKLYCDPVCPTDVDGEKGPELPLEISVLKQEIEIFVP